MITFKKGTSEGNSGLINELGGKGAHLCDMANLGVNVPPGLIIPASKCVEYYNHNTATSREALLRGLALQASEQIKELFPANALFSVRSGARVSMPGMMDTILNVGIQKTNVHGLSPKVYLDCRRRFLQMFGTTVYRIDPAKFEYAITKTCGDLKDSELEEAYLSELIVQFEKLLKERAPELPMESVFDTQDQLYYSIKAVFDSWNSERAVLYRKLHGYSDSWGTAVVIQQMVFGNFNNSSGSGVMFTRNPSTGEPSLYGDYLVNAQGEDVVAGVRTPDSIYDHKGLLPRLQSVAKLLEERYRDMQDVEFTVQDGELFILQTRSGKRTPQAAFRIALDMLKEGAITLNEAAALIQEEHLAKLNTVELAETFKVAPIGTGIPASPGIVSGKAVFTCEAAIKAKGPVILVRKETTPDDLAGMVEAVGILTKTGGSTSHAAVVARGLNKTCVTGLTGMKLTEGGATIKKATIKEGDVITIDGTTGHVYLGAADIVKRGLTNEAVDLLSRVLDLKGMIPAYHLYQVTDEVLERHGSKEIMINVHDDKTTAEVFSHIFALAATHNTKLTIKASINICDANLALMFGVTPEHLEHEALKDVVGDLLKAKVKGDVTLVLPPTFAPLHSAAIAAGYKVSRSIRTAADLILCTEDVLAEVHAKEIAAELKSDEAFKRLMVLVKKNGAKFSAIPVGRTLTAALSV